MARHKLAVIVSATNELLRSAEAENLIWQMFIESTALALDKAIFSASPATAEQPAGILNGIAALPSSGNMIEDLIALVTATASVSGNGQIVFVASPDVGADLNLLSRPLAWPLLVSATLPAGMLICIARPAFVSVVAGVPSIDASAGSTVHEEDTAPATDIGYGVMAAPIRSYFQTDTVGLRLIWTVSWGLRDPRGVAWMQR